jgi:hypothetical protein
MDIKLNTETMQEVGDNVKAAQVGDLIVLVIETGKDLGPSSTGKMNFVDNTHSFTRLPGGLVGSIMIGKKNK